MDGHGELCTKADKALWLKRAQAEFEADMNACAPSCMGGARCTAGCLEKRQPDLSPVCLSAFGELAACSARKCWSQCMMGASPKCEECVVAQCNPAFFQVTLVGPVSAQSRPQLFVE